MSNITKNTTVKAKDLFNSGMLQQRWMSIPESRLVINPYDFSFWDPKKPQAEFTDSAKIPLNLGFLDPYYHEGDGGNRLYDTLMILAAESGKCLEAKSFSTSWTPYMLGFNATYPNGTEVTGKDYFYSTETIIREIDFSGIQPVIGGTFYNASSCLEEKDIPSSCALKDNSIVISNKNYSIAISFNIKMDFTFYPDYESLSANLNPSKAPLESGSYWKAEMADCTNDKKIIIAVTALSNLSSPDIALSKSIAAANDSSLESVLKQNEQFWDNYLAKVPVPGSFNFEMIDSKGISKEDVERLYYEAWILLAADVLPENPETGFNYKQMACGKPSMWAWGHPTAAFTAAWDSIYAYHMYAFIDPELVWNCFTGLMSLVERSDDVNKNGMLAGESLPVNRARTAWLLYEMLPDKSKLEKVFDDLDVNLRWSINHTSWIYRGNAGLDDKKRDPDFTVAALVDMPYMIKICNELGKADKAKEWESNLKTFLEEFPSWHIFKENINGEMVDIARGNILWTCKALYSPLLTEEQDMAFYRRLLTKYDKSKTFMGFDGVKVEEIMYTIYGLYDNNFTDMAKALTESSIREIAITRMFSENYTSDETPAGWGVRASMFGVAQLIDSIWIRNGFRYDTCQPTIQNFFGDGSVSNLSLGDKCLDYSMENGKVSLSGSYVGDTLTVQLADGEKYKIK